MTPVRVAAPLLSFALLVATGCGGAPMFGLPGGALTGAAGSASSWSEVVTGNGVLELETRLADPYSVRIGFVLKGERIYVDPAEGRAWGANMKADPAVRVRIDGRVYAATAVSVTSADERAGFDADRHVFRLDLKP